MNVKISQLVNSEVCVKTFIYMLSSKYSPQQRPLVLYWSFELLCIIPSTFKNTDSSYTNTRVRACVWQFFQLCVSVKRDFSYF
jgi:hypothetical protein